MRKKKRTQQNKEVMGVVLVKFREASESSRNFFSLFSFLFLLFCKCLHFVNKRILLKINMGMSLNFTMKMSSVENPRPIAMEDLRLKLML